MKDFEMPDPSIALGPGDIPEKLTLAIEGAVSECWALMETNGLTGIDLVAGTLNTLIRLQMRSLIEDQRKTTADEPMLITAGLLGVAQGLGGVIAMHIDGSELPGVVNNIGSIVFKTVKAESELFEQMANKKRHN